MATQDTHPKHAHRLPTDTAIESPVGILERWRQRLQSQRTRRALAAGLRRTADPNQPPSRFDPCPVLIDRAQAVGDQLLELADTLEQTQTPNPASIAQLRELLTNGASPLYNPNLPADDLGATLARARAGITTQPTTNHPRPQSADHVSRS